MEGKKKSRPKTSPRKETRKPRRTHFKDLEPKRKKAEETSRGDARNLTESLAEDREKVGKKESIGRKRKGAERRRSKEEELLQCLELIEIAKDRLLDSGKEEGGGGGVKQGEEKISGESTDISITFSR